MVGAQGATYQCTSKVRFRGVVRVALMTTHPVRGARW
jgi:hypothetical protein